MSHRRLPVDTSWQELPDCIYLTERLGCSRLALSGCKGAGCTFCQSREEQDASRRRAEARLASLDEALQQRIAAKYYCGKRIWLGAGVQKKGEDGCSP